MPFYHKDVDTNIPCIKFLSGLTQNEDFVCGRGIICSEKRSVRMVHEHLNEDHNEGHGQKLKFCVSPVYEFSSKSKLKKDEIMEHIDNNEHQQNRTIGLTASFVFGITSAFVERNTAQHVSFYLCNLLMTRGFRIEISKGSAAFFGGYLTGKVVSGAMYMLSGNDEQEIQQQFRI